MGVGQSKGMKSSEIKKLKKQTNLDKVEINSLYKEFSKIAPSGSVDRTKFQDALQALERHGLNEIANTPYSDRLFTLLDINEDGVVDFKEFISGFALLCKGSVEDKIKVSFNAYDKDGDGTISKDELAEMFKYAWMSGFKAMKSLSSEEITPQEIKEFCEQSAKAFADSVMEQMDTDGNGNFLSIDMKVF
mmetsp:Transcript_9559/g.11810  ORF Transcript_9559/g.11810 Transcript_9559/m.11810 type:complete len:190 (-) Transcript_9559:2-571(-)